MCVCFSSVLVFYRFCVVVCLGRQNTDVVLNKALLPAVPEPHGSVVTSLALPFWAQHTTTNTGLSSMMSKLADMTVSS